MFQRVLRLNLLILMSCLLKKEGEKMSMKEFHEEISKVIRRMEDVANIVVGDENVNDYLCSIYGVAEVEDDSLYFVAKYIADNLSRLL